MPIGTVDNSRYSAYNMSSRSFAEDPCDEGTSPVYVFNVASDRTVTSFL